jgi:hypothetical protein
MGLMRVLKTPPGLLLRLRPANPPTEYIPDTFDKSRAPDAIFIYTMKPTINP